jgi:hypothetical protein
MKEVNDELWISDLTFLADVTGHLNSLKQLRGKKKLITEMSDTIKAFKVKI